MNRKEYLFVDGYNIINDWDELKRLSSIDLQSARDRLVEIMVEYKAMTSTEVVIVYDAHMVKGSCEKIEKIKGIEVVFTKEHQTADAYIEKTLDKIGKIKRVRVATSDFLEQQIILGRGGTRISARELKLEVDQYKSRVEKTRKINNIENNTDIGRVGEDIQDALKTWKELYLADEEVKKEKDRNSAQKSAQKQARRK